jgi:hypothetical protein
MSRHSNRPGAEMSGPPEFVVHRSERPIIQVEPVRSVLYITPRFSIHHTTPRPNRWWRFWYWVLLGWRWKRV